MTTTATSATELRKQLAQLQRVSHKLAMTDAAQLGSVLHLLLPRLLVRIGRNQTAKQKESSSSSSSSLLLLYDQIHKQLVEILSDVIKRVRADPTCPLPVQAILDLLLLVEEDDKDKDMKEPNKDDSTTTTKFPKPNPSVDPFTLNLALTFLTLGIPRIPLYDDDDDHKTWSMETQSSSSVSSLCHSLLMGFLVLLPLHHSNTPQVQSHPARRMQATQVAHLILHLLERLVLLSTTSTENKKENNKDNKDQNDGLDQIRLILEQNENVTCALYDLLLDGLLYQHVATSGGNSDNTSSTNLENVMPPPGLAVSGHVRLIQGTTTTTMTTVAQTTATAAEPSSSNKISSSSNTNWKWNMTQSGRLVRWKLMLLTLIAPTRRVALFLGPTINHDTNDKPSSSSAIIQPTSPTKDAIQSGVPLDYYHHYNINEESSRNNNNNRRRRRNLARTIALLVVASGDAHGDVKERAEGYLKAYLDTLRGQGGRVGRDRHDATSNSETVQQRQQQRVVTKEEVGGFGDWQALTVSLLTLVLGQSNAESLSKSFFATKTSIDDDDNNIPSAHLQLASSLSSSTTTTTTYASKVVLSTKRRMVSDSTAGAILNFVSSKILEDDPQRLTMMTMMIGVSTTHTSTTTTRRVVEWTIRLCVLASARFLQQPMSTHFSTRAAAAPSVAAAQLLYMICLRLQTITAIHKNDVDDGNSKTDVMISIMESLSKACELVSRVLGGVIMVGSSSSSLILSSSSSSQQQHQGTLAIRDACYGTMCTLARNKAFLSYHHPKGGEATATTTTTTLSHPLLETSTLSTARLLFGCATKEHETLRPRALAALDALLAAYCRVYVTTTSTTTATKDYASSSTSSPPNAMQTETGPIEATVTATTANPWAVPVTNNNISEATNTVSDVATESVAKKARSDGHRRRRREEDELSSLAGALLPVLWNAARPTTQTKTSRVAAARWTSELLLPLDKVNACQLLCFLSGDSDVTASAIARDEGLGLKDVLGEPPNVHDGADHHHVNTKMETLPEFAELVATLFPNHQGRGSVMGHNNNDNGPSWRLNFDDFSTLGKATALRFTLNCLLADIYGGDDQALQSFIWAIAHCLRAFGTSATGKTTIRMRDAMDLLDECSICLATILQTSQPARLLILSDQACPYKLEDLMALALFADSSKARRYIADCCGYLFEDAELWTIFEHEQTDDWITSSYILMALRQTSAILTEALRTQTTTSFVLGEVHGACFLGSRALRAFRLRVKEDEASDSIEQCWKHSSSILESMGRGLGHSDDVVGGACSQGITLSLSYDSVDAPVLDERLFSACASLLTSLVTAMKKYSGTDHTDALRTTVLAEATGVVLAATTTGAGRSSADSGTDIGASRLACVKSLLLLIGSPACRKEPDIALTVGEALALFSDAFNPKQATWSGYCDVWPDGFDEQKAEEMPPHQQVLYYLLRSELLSSSPHKRTATASALLGVVGRATKAVNDEIGNSNRALMVEIGKNLIEVQQAFITLLGDPKIKQLPRESCCLGLSACFGFVRSMSSVDTTLGNASSVLNDRLLFAFGHTSNDGGSAMMESRTQNAQRRREENRDTEGSSSNLTEPFGIETEVGGAAGLGEASLGAYREMTSAAVALGRPDILYSLLVMSISDPYWFSAGPREKYSAAALLGKGSFVGGRTNLAELRTALRPHISVLLPRLLRARHDPNKATREQIETLWLGLTGGGADARRAITENLLPTMDSLIKDAGSRLWRARVGACGALAEIIAGRSWEDLGGGPAVLSDDEVMEKTSTSKTLAGVRLLRLWRVSMRALDDVRLAVRESGETLARSVRALTVRLCDQTYAAENTSFTDHEKVTQIAASTSLRWLLTSGMKQQCAEAVGVSISCLVGIIDVVSPETLEPALSDLIGSLIMAMSGLEPAALNYLQVRAAGRRNGDYEELERARLKLAQSGPIGGALQKCLDMIPKVELNTQKSLVSHFDHALRAGVGFATRAAAADAVSTMCRVCPEAFKFSGVSSSNPTVRLLRALYFASEKEHGPAAKDKMANAFGNLAQIAPGKTVRGLAVRICDRYNRCNGSNDDPAARRAAASALKSIAVRASSQFADGGPRDIWCRRVLPIAFLGMKDSDSKIASLWTEVWEEGGQVVSATGSSRASGFLLQERLLDGVTDAIIEAVKDLSWVRRVSGATSIIDLCKTQVLSPPPRLTDGSFEEGSSERLRTRARASCMVLDECIAMIVRPRIWTGKNMVIKAAVELASGWSLCAASTFSPRVLIFPSENEQNDLFAGDDWFISDKMDVDSDIDEDAANGNVGASGEQADDLSDNDAEQESDARNERELTDESIQTVSFLGLARVLLREGLKSSGAILQEDLLPYRSAAIDGIATILASISIEDTDELIVSNVKSLVYDKIFKELLEVISSSTDPAVKTAPLIVAKCLDALGNCFWNDFGAKHATVSSEDDAMELLKALRVAGGPKQSAWTVRESSCKAAAKLVRNVTPKQLCRHAFVEILLGMAKHAQTDRKFWRVRLAGLEILDALVGRVRLYADNTKFRSTIAASKTVGESDNEKQLMMEALLPYKEEILLVCRKSLADSESQVTSSSTAVLGSMSWWP